MRVSEEIVAFGGVNGGAPFGEPGVAREMENFLVDRDGALVTRAGFGLLAELAEEVRGLHVLRAAEGDMILAVAGQSLYRIPLGGEAVESGPLPAVSAGRVCFFAFEDVLYLVDGTELYQYGGGVSLSPARGYVPLYGRDWGMGLRKNPVNEPINMLSPYVRIHYRGSGPEERLYLGIKASSVRLFAPEGELDSSQYQLSRDGTVVEFTSEEGFDPSEEGLTVFARLAEDFWHDGLLRTATQAAAFDGFFDQRILLYGGERPELLYISRPVSREQREQSLLCDPGACGLYFPRGGEFSFGSGQAITGVARLWDRLMICTGVNAWLAASSEEGELVARLLSSSAGCVGGMVVPDGATPLTLSPGGLTRWEIDPSEEWSCRRVCLSHGVAPVASAGFFGAAKLFYAPSAGQVWLVRPGEERGQVWIYEPERGLWFSYVGIDAVSVFEAGERLGFCDWRRFYLFDSARDTDECPFGEREIRAVYTGLATDFGDSHVAKRGARLLGEVELPRGELAVGLYDGGLLDEAVLPAGSTRVSVHMGTRRFYRLSLSLRASGRGRKKVYGVRVRVRK